ncbi:nicotinate-nucleotide adenylyltransferase [Aliidiomarina soli]|uniref:Probable nicotinate-nucleotide adenylyltransferase n=1 Tax=Aliidiomarina soli TaxID=1928574 RepID=A0A432WLI7_9GAMM|nr:nicotinate-nucleotide adenylyltransferase [Aliidiomarina soli]RUO34549.1 nicotinic acid mononucleotide adenylyltransferase [Aliidiomarina soli]
MTSPLTAKPAPIALLGGTFDPIHQGHIEPVLKLADTFGWSHVHLQPCFAPPHRPQPEASDQQRLAMVTLACQQDSRLLADDFELRQGKPTRTVHTLHHVRQQHPNASVCFIMGMDSFLQFTSWLNWQQILDLAHLVVLPRPGYQLTQLPPDLAAELKLRQRGDSESFSQGAGFIYLAETPTVDISATALRRQLAQSPDTSRIPLLDPAVLAYIRSHNLYQSTH